MIQPCNGCGEVWTMAICCGKGPVVEKVRRKGISLSPHFVLSCRVSFS
jgi:hypothetical protein